MKFNWGFKIAFFYTAFVVFILGMIYLAFGENFDLVTEDYYQQELEFQDKIDKSANARFLDKKLQIKLSESHVELVFPQEAIPTNGTIMFFRPSNEKNDFMIKLKENEALQSVEKSLFEKGKYLVKIDWKSGETSFYQENTIIIP